ncbi:MAG: hypothetical protein AB1752_09180 [Candidatus Zixiibacteriota bacterium]
MTANDTGDYMGMRERRVMSLRAAGGRPQDRVVAFHIAWLFAAILFALYSAPAAAAQVAIIANKSVPVDSVSQSEVLEIYTGELREWKNGSPIVAYDLTAEGTVRDQFYEFIGRKSSRIKSIWMKNLLMGEGSPPESLKTEEDVLGRVAKTPGAIGFVRPEMANDSVKILAVVTPLTGSD